MGTLVALCPELLGVLSQFLSLLYPVLSVGLLKAEEEVSPAKSLLARRWMSKQVITT